MRRNRALAALAAASMTAGCQYSPDMLDRAIAYNRTISESTNELLLLNIVRASQRMPTFYTRLENGSSSGSVTPNVNSSIPIGKQRQLETDLNRSALGALTGSTIKSVATLAGLAANIGLQGSESNSVTLQTLDDQKYQNGMMTPVPLRHIQAFQDEGYQRDLLFLMFVSNIRVADRLLDAIDQAVGARCDQLERQGDTGAASFGLQICRYARNKPYGDFFPGEGRGKAIGGFSLVACRQSGSAIPDDPPGNMVTFINDPAREPLRTEKRRPHPSICFQMLVDDLLILGLRVGSAQDVPDDLIDTVTDRVADDPKFRSDMIQQKYRLKRTADGMWAVCRKKEQDNGFTLSFINPGEADDGAADLGNLLRALSPTRGATAAQNPCQRRDGDIATLRAVERPMTAMEAMAPDIRAVEATPDDPQSTAPRPIKLSSDKVAFTARSFEAMIYYLGETVRYEDFADSDPASLPHVLGRNPDARTQAPYFETMFYATSRVAGEKAAVSVRDDAGKTYGVPRICAGLDVPLATGDHLSNCTLEYPDNESLQLLTFLNQVWGLQKESTAAPGPPLVLVSP